jgi:hypothetical protein
VNHSPEKMADVELYLRTASWKALVRDLKAAVCKNHHVVELSKPVRTWLELDRTPGVTTYDEALAAMAGLEDDIHRDYLAMQMEFLPISGWVISACHFLKDGTRWWLFFAKRHDDAAPLIGPTVPAPASDADLRKLRKIIAYAGGPKEELFRTGAITKEDRDRLLADGHVDVAEYGQISYWWKA